MIKLMSEGIYTYVGMILIIVSIHTVVTKAPLNLGITCCQATPGADLERGANHSSGFLRQGIRGCPPEVI